MADPIIPGPDDLVQAILVVWDDGFEMAVADEYQAARAMLDRAEEGHGVGFGPVLVRRRDLTTVEVQP